MIGHEARHEEIAVIVTRLHPEAARLPPHGHGLRKIFGSEQIKELVRTALIDQHRRVIDSAPSERVAMRVGRLEYTN